MNRPKLTPANLRNKYVKNVRLQYCQDKTEWLWEKPVPMPLFPQKKKKNTQLPIATYENIFFYV